MKANKTIKNSLIFYSLIILFTSSCTNNESKTRFEQAKIEKKYRDSSLLIVDRFFDSVKTLDNHNYLKNLSIAKPGFKDFFVKNAYLFYKSIDSIWHLEPYDYLNDSLENSINYFILLKNTDRTKTFLSNFMYSDFFFSDTTYKNNFIHFWNTPKNFNFDSVLKKRKESVSFFLASDSQFTSFKKPQTKLFNFVTTEELNEKRSNLVNNSVEDFVWSSNTFGFFGDTCFYLKYKLFENERFIITNSEFISSSSILYNNKYFTHSTEYLLSIDKVSLKINDVLLAKCMLNSELGEKAELRRDYYLDFNNNINIIEISKELNSGPNKSIELKKSSVKVTLNENGTFKLFDEKVNEGLNMANKDNEKYKKLWGLKDL